MKGNKTAQTDNPYDPQHLREGMKTGLLRRKAEPLLHYWHGDDKENETIPFLPRTQPINEVLDRVVRKVMPADKVAIASVQDNWAEIAGGVAAKKTTPSRIDNHVLYVEVSHPAYLMAVNTVPIKHLILTKLDQLLGVGVCQSIAFVPAGGRARPAKGF